MVNQKAISLYGASNEEELIGKNAFDFIVKEDHPRAELNFKEIFETGSIRNIQYLMIRKDGSVFPAELSAAAIFDKDNRPTSLIGVIRDITERKRAEEKLRRQKEELSDFAHFIAHDVSNCLTTIEGYTQLLDLEYDETHIISKQVEYMKNLLIRSLMLADAGLAVEKTDFTNLNTLARRIAEATIPKDIEFNHDNLPTVLCDEEKLGQVFKNLFENAVIHGKPQKIEIGIIKNENYTTLLINNDGHPIPTTVREQIFDYGFTTLKESMGLGLSIVRKIIEAHGWHINVQSNDELTSFQIAIPFVLNENNQAIQRIQDNHE
jgi:PAS domain S-box-containing protein